MPSTGCNSEQRDHGAALQRVTDGLPAAHTLDAGGYVQSQLALRKVWCQPLASACCVHAEHRSQESSSPAGGVKGFVSDTYCAHVVHLVAGTVALAYMASASGTGGQSSRALSPPPLMSTPRPQLPAE